MSKSALLISFAVCLCLLLSACSAGQEPAPTAGTPALSSTEESSVPTVPETTSAPEVITVPTVPVTSSAPEETTVPTLPEETAPTELEAAADDDDSSSHFFDDAAFIGDSISYTLMLHNTKTGDLGNAVFLTRGSLGLHNTLSNMLKVYYGGQAMTPWDALAASGVSKVFIMLGTNDIGYYGIDATMEKWEIYLENIRQASPDIQIYIQSLTPMWYESEKGALCNDNIDLYNQELQRFAEENGCHYVDIASPLKDENNSLAREYCNDFYVHMNYEGTAVWADTLNAYAAELETEME